MRRPPVAPTRRLRARERAGFTLLELIIGLALLSIAAAIAIPAHFGRPEVTLHNAGQLLCRDLHSLRVLAINGARPVELQLDRTGYTAVDTAGRTLVHPRTGMEFRRDYPRDAVFRGVRVGDPDSHERIRIQVDAIGRVDGPEELRLTFGDDWLAIRIDPETGTASLGEASMPGSIDDSVLPQP